jgi:hypothetical protein
MAATYPFIEKYVKMCCDDNTFSILQANTYDGPTGDVFCFEKTTARTLPELCDAVLESWQTRTHININVSYQLQDETIEEGIVYCDELSEEQQAWVPGKLREAFSTQEGMKRLMMEFAKEDVGILYLTKDMASFYTEEELEQMEAYLKEADRINSHEQDDEQDEDAEDEEDE